MEKISDRLRRLMTERDISQYRLWKDSGVSQPTIKRILDGESKEPDKSTVAKLAGALGCSYEWLYDGTAPGTEAPAEASVGVHDGVAPNLDPDSYVWIDRYDLQLSAGNGNAAWVIKEKDPISFRRSWFERKRLRPEACKALYVRGRSMEPALNDWDTVLIDTDDTELVDGDIYAVAFRGRLYIKTLERTATGLRLKSENTSFDSIDVQNGDSEHLRILGRKVWRAG